MEPVEQIEDGINRIHEEVGASLLQRLREGHPDFFEDAVVKLLLTMGYGGAEQRGRRIGGSGDGGVDGIIDQDALGLDRDLCPGKAVRGRKQRGPRRQSRLSSVRYTE